ncbi:regulatory protein RecX [Herbiconiux daphne]|uniref:Regulatory protein RecX n=1 Tax=Herbiconiux daphne TaxID=2970914 RepID=A0ABT2GYX2_9MICO|nr:RecX family transcriptional regulator [Herbiconiux daphne]MCS5733157.1 RecX family transcriptional regulator [Herbiconiux daphne]
MNDIISLDSVRRGRGRAAAPRSGAEVELDAGRPANPADAGAHESASPGSASPEEWYTGPSDAPAPASPRSGNHPAGRARSVAKPPADLRPAHETPVQESQVHESPVHQSQAEPATRPAALSVVSSLAPVVELPVVPEMSDEERLERVSDTVIRALGRRQLSADETHSLLMAQGASDEEAVVLIARYEELGYLDDLALAESLVERLSERNHKSRAVIARELHARKIPSAYVDAALEQLDDDEEFDRALEAALKRAGQLSSYDHATAERRLMGFLARRGYASAVVREVTRRALAERKGSGGPRFR